MNSNSMETNAGSWMRHRNNSAAPHSSVTTTTHDDGAGMGSPTSSFPPIGSAAVYSASATITSPSSNNNNVEQSSFWRHSSTPRSSSSNTIPLSNSIRRHSSAGGQPQQQRYFAAGADGTSSPHPSYKFRNHSYSSAGREASSGGRWKYNLLLLIVGLVLLVAPWIRHIQTHYQVRSLQNELEMLQTKQSLLQKDIQNQITTLKKIKAETTEYKTQNDNLLGQLKVHGDEYEDFDSSAYVEAEEMENNYLLRVDELEREIQRAAGRKLVHRGHGVLGSSAPMRAVVTLARDVRPEDATAALSRTLVLEMAPTHTYPHAIAYFMDMVHQRRLFDGWTFMRTATGSVLYTVPWDYQTRQFREGANMDRLEISKISTNGAPGSTLLDRMAVKELPQLPGDYPIEKYSGTSVGVVWLDSTYSCIFKTILSPRLSNRRIVFTLVMFSDHGPNFYIVLTDEINAAAVNRDEVCFAKVVEGQAILDYIADHSHHNNGVSSKTYMVGIESIRMMEAIEEDDEAIRWQPASRRTIEYRVLED